ncbi:hypothetical protein HO173_001289 [Letharia columbiana]|uniref:Cytochrome P450 n=1 Tax=Letharia columbiana TaxID=112416 RepID=A0A8H6G4W7_9LECA|nr:uncharacterized protein HO173_001289 [Letharia columbiana]KAF6240618.1 hypothetical protein HO173_001289 [Letharia columbiana]
MVFMESVPVVPVTHVILAFGTLWALYLCGRITYNVYWHPLAKFPGPKLHVATFIPYYWATWLGNLNMSTRKLHDRYGHVVRINPNTLSFVSAQSWKDIHGHRPGRIQLPKNREALEEKNQPPSIASIIGDADHARVRGLISPAFSERAMREQESLIMGYIDLLIQRLKAQIQGPNKGEVDLVRWYNFTTFDIVGDLALGEPFGSLESGEYHFWISNIFRGIKTTNILAIGNAYPIIGALISCAFRLSPKAGEARQRHREYSKVALQRRMAKKVEKKDFMSYILRRKDESGLTDDELNENASILILAGSETTATLLSGATYYLLTNKVALDKVCDEVRGAFQSEGNITFASVTRLPYLNAVIEESLRLYPPVPSTLPRRTLAQGNVIDGHFVPGNTTVGVNHWSAYRSKDNFRDPETFVPERWLDDPVYANDQRAVLQPFAIGPRNCIGKNLAYAEMRSILARMLWHFDMELCEASKGWTDQLAFVLWEKPALLVKLTERTDR